MTRLKQMKTSVSDHHQHKTMENIMTKEQIKWARSHDWYIQDNGDVVMVLDEYEPNHIQIFSNFKLLREWAGY